MCVNGLIVVFQFYQFFFAQGENKKLKKQHGRLQSGPLTTLLYPDKKKKGGGGGGGGGGVQYSKTKRMRHARCMVCTPCNA